MRGELGAIVTDLQSAERRLRALREKVPAAAWGRRPRPESWSPGECVAHLNLTSEAFLPLLRTGLDQARRLGGAVSARYRRDFTGWLIWRMVTPSGTLKTRTAAPFVPSGARPAEMLVADFARLQAQVVAVIGEGDGLPLDRVKIVSPFNARAKYNIYAALTIIPRHQHRHLLQAERAAGASRSNGSMRV